MQYEGDMKKTFTIAGIGELLWDVFPEHKRLGGAPANFSCHCKQLSAEAYTISCVGTDSLGKSLCEELNNIGVDTSYVLESKEHKTGMVKVSLNNQGKPIYEIIENVAWDFIPYTQNIQELAQSLNAVCFGSLAQRSSVSRKTIQTFLQNMPQNSLKIFDVNIRQSFYSKKLIEESLQLANVLKLSDEELPVLADFFKLDGDVPNQIKKIQTKFNLDLVAYTRGAEGSLLLNKSIADDFPGLKANAIDSVGAGDSFTASLCIGLLRGWPLNKINLFANKVASFVCSQKGATPILPKGLIELII